LEIPSGFPLSHSFNNNKLDDRDHFRQNAKTSVASLRGLIGSSRNTDRHHSGMLIDFIGIPILTEAQASAKDAVIMSTNTFPVTSWDDHTLTAVTEFYADKSGNQTDKTSPGATKYVFRLVINFETHQMTKFVEASTGNTLGYHLADQ
jgi:hypothetical protein